MALGMGTLLAEIPHPRLLFTPEMEAEVEQRIVAEPVMQTIHGVVLERADEILDERTCQYLIPDGKRLLRESRRAMGNILYCGIAWRTTDKASYRDRMIRELDAAVALKDWNPSHFLDTAEMATAVALGYDWLFHTLNPEQRKRYEDALIDKGLRAQKLEFGKTPWWFRGARNNWTQVCATGMALAADAVRSREPELAAKVIADCRKALDACESFYLPDGGYPEGPGYWHYGTNYHVIGLAACSSFGEGMEDPAILERSGDFIMQLIGPMGQNFNFADGPAHKRLPTPAQSWIATRFKNQGQAGIIRSQLHDGLSAGLDGSRKGPRWKKGPGQYFPLHLLWLPPAPEHQATLSLAEAFNGEQPIATARTGWASDDAWLAIKGGTGAASHGHLDAGSFIYEAGGVRWFHDLGADNYNLPGYFYDNRWDYFRLTNLTHNTLVIGGELQKDPHTGCPHTPWQVDDGKLSTTIDLTSVYADQAASAHRRATFGTGDGHVLIEDQLKSPQGKVRWAVVTRANPEIDGSTLTLEQDGQRLVLTRLDTEGGEWEEYSLKPPTEAENQNQGFRLLGFTAEPKESLNLKVGWKLE